MGLLKTQGIVTKTTKYSETSLIVTIITKDFGRISAIANNVRSGRSHMLMGLQLFAFSEIVMYGSRSKSGLYKLNEMTVIESFAEIRNSLEKLAYAAYFAEAANNAIAEDSPDEEILRLLLNSLFALERDLYPFEKIKTVFEWRLAAASGYEPRLEACGSCGKNLDGVETLLSLSEGQSFCPDCGEGRTGCVRLTSGMCKVVDYICRAESRRIFSFDAGKKTFEYLSRISERYLGVQLDREFSTLDYLKKVIGLE